MTTPRKSEIEKHATELYVQECYRSGHPELAETLPTRSELSESGFIQEARSQLMRNRYRSEIENRDYLEDINGFQCDLEEAMRTGLFISGTSHSGKTNLGFILADRLMKEGVIVYVADPSQAWKNSSIPNLLTVKWNSQIKWNDGTPKQSTVFDISRLTVLQQKMFVERFCKTLFNARVNSNYRPKTFLMLEEAHLYFPEGCMRAKAYQEALRIVTVGRNFNIRFGLITQWCALIDKTVIKFPRQKYFGYTDEKNDKQYLRNFIGKHVDELENLEVGEFIYDYGKTTKKIQTPLFKSEVKPRLLATQTLEKTKPRPKPMEKQLEAVSSLFAFLSIAVFLLMLLMVVAT